MTCYFCCVINIVILLQWAQVYKVISNPMKATETIVQNWAVKMECLFISLETLFVVSSIYFTLLDRLDENQKREIIICKTISQIFCSVLNIVLIGLYVTLLCLFIRLIKAENEFLEPMKAQVTIFFSVAISTMVLKTSAATYEVIVSLQNEEDDKVSEQMSTLFFWLGSVNMMADLSFTGLITYYLMTSVKRDKQQLSVSILGNSI